MKMKLGLKKVKQRKAGIPWEAYVSGKVSVPTVKDTKPKQ